MPTWCTGPLHVEHFDDILQRLHNHENDHGAPRDRIWASDDTCRFNCLAVLSQSISKQAKQPPIIRFIHNTGRQSIDSNKGTGLFSDPYIDSQRCSDCNVYDGDRVRRSHSAQCHGAIAVFNRVRCHGWHYTCLLALVFHSSASLSTPAPQHGGKHWKIFGQLGFTRCIIFCSVFVGHDPVFIF